MLPRKALFEKKHRTTQVFIWLLGKVAGELVIAPIHRSNSTEQSLTTTELNSHAVNPLKQQRYTS